MLLLDKQMCLQELFHFSCINVGSRNYFGSQIRHLCLLHTLSLDLIPDAKCEGQVSSSLQGHIERKTNTNNVAILQHMPVFRLGEDAGDPKKPHADTGQTCKVPAEKAPAPGKLWDLELSIVPSLKLFEKHKVVSTPVLAMMSAQNKWIHFWSVMEVPQKLPSLVSGQLQAAGQQSAGLSPFYFISEELTNVKTHTAGT